MYRLYRNYAQRMESSEWKNARVIFFTRLVHAHNRKTNLENQVLEYYDTCYYFV